MKFKQIILTLLLTCVSLSPLFAHAPAPGLSLSDLMASKESEKSWETVADATFGIAADKVKKGGWHRSDSIPRAQP